MSAAAIRPALVPQVVAVAQKTWLTGLTYAVSDGVAVVLAVTFGLAAFRLLNQTTGALLEECLPAVLALTAFAFMGLYKSLHLNPEWEFRQITVGSAMSFALASGFLPHRQPAALPFLARYALTCFVSIVLILAGRFLCRALFSGRAWWGKTAVLFGSGNEARSVFRSLQRHPTGLKIVAVCSDGYLDWPELDRTRIHVTHPELMASFAANHSVPCAILAKPSLTGAETAQRLRDHAAHFKHVLVLPGISDLQSARVQARAIGGMLALDVSEGWQQHGARLCKRLLDIGLTSAGAFIALPLLVMLCLAVKCTSPGPVFYGHVRLGRGNKTFTAWKFRSMHQDADRILAESFLRNPALRREWHETQKLKNDPRVTAVGRLLRKTSLDEIPQLWNVLAGHMSLVGPRPIVKGEVARYGKTYDNYREVRPGITGLWQVSGRNNTSYEERVQMDEHYVRNWSIWLDLYILSRTIKTVLLGEGAY